MIPNPTLKDILIQFLREEPLHYPHSEITILSSNPFQFTDDSQHYFESQNLHEIYSTHKTQNPNAQARQILLKDWNFVFRRVPNTHDYYFDIVCTDYDFLTTKTPTLDPSNLQLKKVISDDAVKYAFEVRKRKLICQFIKNESNTGFEVGVGSQAKFLKMLIGKNQSLGQGPKNVIFGIFWGKFKFFVGKWAAFGRGFTGL
jgi:hypothetical protein